MNKVQILIDGFEYFKVTNIVLQEVIEGFLSIRTTNIDILFNNITSSDRTKAEKIRDYYSKKIVWWTLNDIRLSNFRQDLKKLIQSDGKVFQENMKALAYRMPEFYDYDTVFDEMFLNYNATIQQSKHQDFVTKKLKLVKTFIRKRRPSTYKEYWFSDENNNLCTISIFHNNPLIALFDLHSKNPFMIEGIFTRKVRDNREYLTVDKYSFI